MKKISLNYLIIAIFAIVTAFVSCDKNNDGDNNGNGNEDKDVYLLVKISEDNDNGDGIKFEYDNQNRIKKMIFDYGLTLLYDYNNAGDLTMMKWEDETDDNDIAIITKNGNKIILNFSSGEHEWSMSFELNAQGLPVKLMTGEDESEQYFIFQYQNGNLKKLESLWWDENDNMTKLDFYMNYTYDDKKSPFYHCKTPKWLFVFLTILCENHYNFGIQNNVISMTSDYGKLINCDYTYNDEGFPLIRKVKEGHNNFTQTFKYEKR